MTIGRDTDVLWTGIPIAAVSSVLVGVALTVFGLELARINGVLALGLNIVVVAGAAPTVFRWRATPVWRWAVYGAATGSVLSFVALGLVVF